MPSSARGDIVGTVLGATRKDYSAVRRIDPVVWRCQFSR